MLIPKLACMFYFFSAFDIDLFQVSDKTSINLFFLINDSLIFLMLLLKRFNFVFQIKPTAFQNLLIVLKSLTQLLTHSYSTLILKLLLKLEYPDCISTIWLRVVTQIYCYRSLTLRWWIVNIPSCVVVTSIDYWHYARYAFSMDCWAYSSLFWMFCEKSDAWGTSVVVLLLS